MGFFIHGIGTAVPPAAIDQETAAEMAKILCHCDEEQATWVPQIFAQTGIRRRHMVFDREVIADVLHGTRLSESVFLPKPSVEDRGPSTRQRMDHYVGQAGPLAIRAAQQALERSGFSPEQITHLVTVSCTGFRAPGVDYELIQGLGLRPTTERVHIGFMGCHGALNGFRVVQALCQADDKACPLLCAVELCSLHFHYRWDPSRMIANALFGDGAAALVGAATGPASAWRVVATGSCLFPASEEAMTWTIGDHGFEMTLSKRVPSLIATHLRPWLTKWLQDQGLRLQDIGSWAIHPGGPKILSSIRETLELSAEATAPSQEILEAYGNMSSPTVLFILEALLRQKAPRPCVALGFGPGLAAEAALLK